MSLCEGLERLKNCGFSNHETDIINEFGAMAMNIVLISILISINIIHSKHASKSEAIEHNKVPPPSPLSLFITLLIICALSCLV